MPRGTVLRDGDRLRAEDGELVARVARRAETLSRGATGDRHLLARAAYHLGNRHVPVQVGPAGCPTSTITCSTAWCGELGLAVARASAPFEPEAGGYRRRPRR